MLLQPPHLAVRAAAELRRIEHDAVVAPPAPHLARGELRRVVDHPADRPIGHVRQEGVGLARLDRLLRRIDMRHPRALGRQRQAADAGIAEQVEHLVALGRSARASTSHCGAMSGKKARWRNGVFCARKRTSSQRTCQPPRGTSRERCHLPPPSSSDAPMKSPSACPVGARRRPHRLRLGADEAEAAVALQLAAVAASRRSP